MPAGRPPRGAKLVEGLEGSVHAKKRLELIIETLSGKRTVGSACEELGVCEAAFYKLRTRTLQEALEGLEPRPLGRPPTERSERDERITRLEGELVRTRRELEAARVREELAVALPKLGQKPSKKTASGKRRRRS